MDPYGGRRYSSIILDLDTRWKAVVSFTRLPLNPRRQNTQYALNKRLCGPQRQSGRYGGEKNNLLLSGIEPRSSNP
jgi:hypothetical protein